MSHPAAILHTPWFWPLFALHVILFSAAAAAESDEDAVWIGYLKETHFGQRPILDSNEVIELDAPVRAADAAAVPITINAGFPQSADRYIQSIHLFVDNNPSALAGVFHFTPNSGRADLALRIRVNEYTPVRAIAETSDGQLHMTRRFVKASGGCSAPASTDLERAMAQLGRMKFKIREPLAPRQPAAAQLMVRHPNVTGLQMDQITRLYSPAHFVRQVKITFNNEVVFSAETDITISENPSFRFYFVPPGDGELEAEIIDSNGLRFTHSQQIMAADDRESTALKPAD